MYTSWDIRYSIYTSGYMPPSLIIRSPNIYSSRVVLMNTLLLVLLRLSFKWQHCCWHLFPADGPIFAAQRPAMNDGLHVTFVSDLLLPAGNIESIGLRVCLLLTVLTLIDLLIVDLVLKRYSVSFSLSWFRSPIELNIDRHEWRAHCLHISVWIGRQRQ